MTRGSDLYQLQSLDSEGDKDHRRLEEIEAELADDEQVRQARQAVESTEKEQRAQATRQRDLELEIQGVELKTTGSEQRLYSGTVKNPRELEDLQAEIAALRRRQQKLEDDLLEVMVALEEAETAHTEAQARLDETTARWSARQAELGDEQKALQDRMAEIDRTREALLGGISAGDLAAYRSLRSKKGGLAVVQMEGDSCGGCGLAISPSLKWEIREESLAVCSNCQRVIVHVQ